MTPLDILLRLLPLDRLPRTGWVLHGVPEPESVAGHILGTAHVALALHSQIEPPLDLGRVLAMALVHDAPEAETGDLPNTASAHLPPGAKGAMEDVVAGELLDGLSGTAGQAWAEYRAQETREARFVALCDVLQLGVRLVGYERSGARGLEQFRGGLERLDCSGFGAAEELRLGILGMLVPFGGAPDPGR